MMLKRVLKTSQKQASGLRRFDEQYTLEHAYIPEHIPGLMTQISKGVPFLAGDYLGFAGEAWLILVGYPLEGRFTHPGCEQAISQARAKFHPATLLFIGPEIPTSLLASVQERSQDVYYTLNLEGFQPGSLVRRALHKGSELIKVEREKAFREEHQALTDQFLQEKPLPRRIAELYNAMPDYLATTSSAALLCARDQNGRLCAYNVVEQAARGFDAYLLGCRSKDASASYASDILFQSMIDLARGKGKQTLNLGLGVNAGIRRFKQKWGGQPALHYEYCECVFGQSKALAMLDAWLEGKL